MSVVTTKLVNPDVPYLSEESLRSHTNAVLTCTDGVRLRTSKILLAAHSPLMRKVMLENDHSQDELATFNVEAHSSLVLQLLQFMHTGCVFNVKTEPHTEGMSLELCSLLRNFGIDHCLVLKQSQRVEALPAPDLAQFIEVGKLEEEGSGMKCVGKEGGEGRGCDDDFAFSAAAAAAVEVEYNTIDVNLFVPGVEPTTNIQSDVVKEEHVGGSVDSDFVQSDDDNDSDYEAPASAKRRKYSSPRYSIKRTRKPNSRPIQKGESLEDNGWKEWKAKVEAGEIVEDTKVEEEDDEGDEEWVDGREEGSKKRGRKPKTQDILTYFDGKHHYDTNGVKYHIDKHGYKVKYTYVKKKKEEMKPRGRPKIMDANERKIITLDETLYHFPQRGETDLTKRFQCDLCVRKFELEEDFNQHVRRHQTKNEAESFTCFFCEGRKTFATEEEYLTHLQECSDDAARRAKEKTDRGVTEVPAHYFHFPATEAEDESYAFRCQLCIRCFKRKDIFELHLRRHLDTDRKAPYVCLICHVKTFSSHRECKKHQKSCKEQNPLPEDVRNLYDRHGLLEPKTNLVQFVCSCGKLSFNKSAHLSHLKIMGPFHSTCGSCQYEFKSKEDHQRHVDEEHGGQMLHRCGLCDRVFSSKFFVDQHKFRDHKGRSFIPRYGQPGAEPNFTAESPDDLKVCEICGKSISSYGYKKHLANHNRKVDQKLPCPHCPGKTFASASSLACHLKAHICPLQCELCGFATYTKGRLQRHIFQHHTAEEDKPFQCDFPNCKKGFATASNLAEHQNIHTNSRPFKCKLCTADFNSKGNMHAHIRQSHKGIKRKK